MNHQDAYGQDGVTAKERGGDPEEWGPPPPRERRDNRGFMGSDKPFKKTEGYTFHSTGPSGFTFGSNNFGRGDFGGASNFGGGDFSDIFEDIRKRFASGGGLDGMEDIADKFQSANHGTSTRQVISPKGGVVEVLDEKSFPRHASATSLWLIAFYVNDSKETAKHKDTIVKMAKNSRDLFKVGAFDCGGKSRKFCKDHGVDSLPKYGAVIDGVVQFWDGNEPTTKALYEFAISQLPTKNVISINRKSSLWRLFEKGDVGILLLTDKFATSPLWKSLAYRFRFSLAFGESRGASLEMGKTFKVKKYPMIVALEKTRKRRPLAKSGFNLLEVYTGDVSARALEEWCKKISETAKGTGLKSKSRRNIFEKWSKNKKTRRTSGDL